MSPKVSKCELRLVFAFNKHRLKKSWRPITIKLVDSSTRKSKTWFIEKAERELIDQPNGNGCYCAIPELKKGVYQLNVIDFDTGKEILDKPRLSINKKIVEYELNPADNRQSNTLDLDFIADAPYRLQKDYPYIPIVVFIKDIESDDIKIQEINIFDTHPPDYTARRIEPDGIHLVMDKDGEILLRESIPYLLKTSPGQNYETVTNDPWARIILVRRDQFSLFTAGYLGRPDLPYLQFAVKVSFLRNGIEDERLFIFRTLVPGTDLPKLENWYYGDTHCHSEFTDNPYEYGGPLMAMVEAAKAVGLSWLTITDHSYCLCHPPDSEKNEKNRWERYQTAIRQINQKEKEIVLVGAEEVTLRKKISGLHLLSYGNEFYKDTHIAGFGTLKIKEVFKTPTKLAAERGFFFAAHPASSGNTWQQQDYDQIAQSGNGDAFIGLQLFNEKVLYKRALFHSMDRSIINPAKLLRKEDREKKWSKDLDKGIRNHWVEKFLLPSLRAWKPGQEIRKYFAIAGTDSHLDLNCAFRPHLAFFATYLNDNAFGKVRTLAYLPDGVTRESLYTAIRTGRTILTDGPVALFALNCTKDKHIIRSGNTLSVDAREEVICDIEWCSTLEFGSVDQITMYWGTSQGEIDISHQFDFSELVEIPRAWSGQLSQRLPKWKKGAYYMRMEASSLNGLYRCVTNPIWILIN